MCEKTCLMPIKASKVCIHALRGVRCKVMRSSQHGYIQGNVRYHKNHSATPGSAGILPALDWLSLLPIAGKMPALTSVFHDSVWQNWHESQAN